VTRNKNNPDTGKRGELPTPLVGKLFSLERRTAALEKENEELKKKLGGKAEPAPQPPSPPDPKPEPKPPPKAEEPAPAPAKKPKGNAFDSLFGK
jgi:hypothetical protein